MTIHNAPPVVYPLGRSHFLGGVLLVLWLGGLLLAMLWLYTVQRLDWRTGSALLAVLGAGVAVRVGWNNLPASQLVWDGIAWRWESASYRAGTAEYEVSIIADFQSRLLLRLENPASARLWLWMERSVFPDRWLDLRRAVYSAGRAPATALLHDWPPPAVTASETMPLVDIPRIKS